MGPDHERAATREKSVWERAPDVSTDGVPVFAGIKKRTLATACASGGGNCGARGAAQADRGLVNGGRRSVAAVVMGQPARGPSERR
jgi:hypothetical protein